MIIVKLMGGLGNQMFQYAAGRCLAHLHKTELKLDLSYLNADPKNQYTKRDYKLDVLNISSSIANDTDIAPFLPMDKGKIKNTLMRKLPILFSKLIANESGTIFHKEFYSYPKQTYLNGFWQSEKYFEPVKDILFKEFSIKEALNKDNQDLATRITNANSVSLHIRRGDYVENKETRAFHGTCSLEYYKEAINHIKKNSPGASLYVFSDDVAWAKANLRVDVPVHFVDMNNHGYVDMHLMALCKHNIIANSSFSWWGAYLNQNPNKIVVAPKRWFTDGTIVTKDLIPSSWIRI